MEPVNFFVQSVDWVLFAECSHLLFFFKRAREIQSFMYGLFSLMNPSQNDTRGHQFLSSCGTRHCAEGPRFPPIRWRNLAQAGMSSCRPMKREDARVYGLGCL